MLNTEQEMKKYDIECVFIFLIDSEFTILY